MTSLRKITIQARLWLILATAVICVALIEIQALQHLYSAMRESRELTVKTQVENVHSLVNHYYELSQNGISEDEAKELALSAISNLRYSNQEYFWINDRNPSMIMHSVKPELAGKDLSNMQDPNGVYLFKEMVKTVTASSDGGYVNYMWPKPGKDKPQPKVSYVKEFKPWGWIIGTGVYTDDVKDAFMVDAIQVGAPV